MSVSGKFLCRLNLIVDDISTGSDYETILSEMETVAGVTGETCVVESIQYVDGMYNVTLAYYEAPETPSPAPETT